MKGFEPPFSTTATCIDDISIQRYIPKIKNPELLVSGLCNEHSSWSPG